MPEVTAEPALATDEPTWATCVLIKSIQPPEVSEAWGSEELAASTEDA